MAKLGKYLFYTFFLALSSLSQNAYATTSWDELIEEGEGEVVVYYYDIKPFVYKDELGSLTGIEHDIMQSFFAFIERKHDVTITQKWIEIKSFDQIFNAVKKQKGSAFGASVISYTSAREEVVNFSQAYMPDVNVFITNNAVANINDSLELVSNLKAKRAAIMANTTYEHDLDSLQNRYNLSLDYIKVPNDQNIIELVNRNVDIVGYVSLPIYVLEISKGISVKRQSKYQVKRDGYRFIYKKNSGWEAPVSSYFSSYLYKSEANNIIRKYLGDKYSELIWGMARNEDSLNNADEIAFLNQEKEIQSQNIATILRQQQRQRIITVSVSIGLVFIFFTALILIQTNRVKARDNRLLQEKGRELKQLLGRISSQNEEILKQRILLEQKNNELSDLNNQKDELISIVAHDLKTPINQVSGLLQVLKLGTQNLTDENYEILDKIYAANGHLKELVERILDVNALDKKQLHLEFKHIELKKALNQIVDPLRDLANEKNITIQLEPVPEDKYIYADPLLFNQVIENLLSNAFKFSPEFKSVFVSTVIKNRTYRIVIRDEGPGISKEDSLKLFSKFQPLSAKPTGNEVSTGLGLSIVKKYVEEMDGRVWCESKLGEGASFIVEFNKAEKPA